MTSWRPSKRHTASRQPSLPGLSGLGDKADAHHRTLHTRRLATPGEHALGRAKGRLALPLAIFAIIYLVIGGRLVDLTLMNETPDISGAQVAMSGELPLASRADILDRNGAVLATSLPTFMLCADAPKLLNPDEAAEKLLSVLPELDKARLNEDLHSAKRCALIKRHLTPRQYYAINKLGIAGLEFHPDEGRIYPAGAVMAHVLGYTDIDNKGIAGIEKGLNARLEQEPEPVTLSIDLRLQTIMHRELSDAVENFHALGGAGMVMDAATGEILAMVSLPDFNPQRPGEATDDAKFNRASLGVYEMGSTFKIFSTALALDSGLVKPSDRFDTTHPIQIGHQTIRDYHPSKHDLNVAEIMMESSNIGAARMAEKVGTARQRAFFNRLGLTEKARIELPEIGAPLVPAAANWGETTTLTAAFGHGIAVSAVQLTAGVATLLGTGAPVRPTLLKAKDPAAAPQPAVVAPRTVAQMRALMRLVVTEGTAKSAEVQGYLVAGKTGTADKITGKRYAENARLSSFVSVFPGNAPRYVVFAMLDDPKGNAKTHGFATGGWTAAPVVGHVIGQIGPLLGVTPMEPDMMANAEHQLLHPLGAELLSALHVEDGTDNYAAVETNTAE